MAISKQVAPEVQALVKALTGLPIVRIAEIAGLSRKTITNIRDGKVPNPGVNTMRRVSLAVEDFREEQRRKSESALKAPKGPAND